MVEVGRFRGVELENRICPICFSEVEDEIHFLFKCQYYNHLRAVFYNNIVAKGYRDFRLSPDHEKLCIIMTANVVKFTGNFICEAFTMREQYMYNSV